MAILLVIGLILVAWVFSTVLLLRFAGLLVTVLLRNLAQLLDRYLVVAASSRRRIQWQLPVPGGGLTLLQMLRFASCAAPPLTGRAAKVLFRPLASTHLT